MSNTEEIQYGECCCCLEKGDHRELTKQYYEGKQPEIYEVLFKDTFDIVLKYPVKTKLICDYCVEKLREASYFRCMVESSQQTLSDRVNWEPDCVIVKEEPIEEVCTEDHEHKTDCREMELGKRRGESQPSTSQPNTKTENFEFEVPIVEVEIKRIKSELEMPEWKETGSNKPTKDDNYGLSPDIIVNKVIPINDLQSRILTCRQSLQRPLKISLPTCKKKLSKIKRLLATESEKSTIAPKEEPVFTCDICNYKSTQKEHLKVHVRTHTGEKPYTCGVCSYRTSQAGCLKIHQRTHTGEKPYLCNVCDYRTASKGNLNVHVRIHTGEKPFPCARCPYRCSDKGKLKVHMRTHTGEKPYSCHMCEFKSSQKGHLTLHLHTHSGEKPYECQLCEYKTSVKRNLVRHVKNNHTGS